MKKFISIFLLICLTGTMLVGCVNNNAFIKEKRTNGIKNMQFFGLKWGITPDEAAKTLGIEKESFKGEELNDNEIFTYIADINIEGEEIQLGLLFSSFKLEKMEKTPLLVGINFNTTNQEIIDQVKNFNEKNEAVPFGDYFKKKRLYNNLVQYCYDTTDWSSPVYANEAEETKLKMSEDMADSYKNLRVYSTEFVDKSFYQIEDVEGEIINTVATFMVLTELLENYKEK